MCPENRGTLHAEIDLAEDAYATNERKRVKRISFVSRIVPS